MTSQQLEVEVHKHGDLSVVAMRGRLDAAQAAFAREQVAHLAGSGHSRIVLDLADLGWIDSSGVGVLVSLSRRSRGAGGDVRVAGLNGQPKEIFRLLRLELAFPIFESIETALNSYAVT